MASIVGIFTGGTDGARDGTLAGSSNRIVLPHDDTPLKVHYRVVDESTLLDNREDTTTTLSPTCEAGLLACFTVDGTYSATPTANATAAHGGNQPLWLKRDGTPAPDLYDLGIGAESFTTGSRLAAPVLTLTPAATSVTATWTEVEGADGYEYRYRVNDGAWSAWATDADRSVVVGSLSQGDEVDFEVYAFDERGTGAVDAESSEATYAFTDTFDTFDTTNRWETVLSGNAAIAASGGRLVSSNVSASENNYTRLKSGQRSLCVADRIYTLTGRLLQVNRTGFIFHGLVNGRLFYLTAYAGSAGGGSRVVEIVVNSATGGFIGWNGSSWASGGQSGAALSSFSTTDYVFILETSVSNGVRFIVKNAGGTALATTGWLAWTHFSTPTTQVLEFRIGGPSDATWYGDWSFDSFSIG